MSRDDGKTWKSHGPATLPNQHPASLLGLSDGRVLLTYGIRNEGLHAIGARVSRDDGASWGHPFVLVCLDGSVDDGYPSSVELDDGTVVTAYYASGIHEHQRYHMGVLRWKLDEFACTRSE